MAEFCGHQKMETILAIFVEKVLQNLMTLSESTSAEEQLLVKQSLECFHVYLLHQISCRQMSRIAVVRQLVTSHISQFQILQGPSQMKDLGHFFRILSLLWVSEEFVNDFTSYLDQLLPTLNQLFGIDSA